jgi:hypothetical protein
MAKLRIYRVNEWRAQQTIDEAGRLVGESNGIVASSLIRAPSQAQAIRHVARRFSAEVATQDDLVQLCAQGVVVEEAAEETA